MRTAPPPSTPLSYAADTQSWSVLQSVETQIFDTYSGPSKEHWLGTDRNGMDMLTRLMYGGRVSLYIGFIVVLISGVLGVILGGISGYFGRWVDNLIMRIVDIFYCIPSMPVIIILGAAMDGMRMDPQIRMIWLMLILGFLGWPSIAGAGPRPDPLPAEHPDFPPSDSQRHPPAHCHLHHEPGLHHHH